jgi:hypothetical protein
MKKTILFSLFLFMHASSALATGKTNDVTFEIYSVKTNNQTQVFLKVTNHSDTPYKMEEPHGGAVMPNYFRYYKSSNDGKWGKPVDTLAPGERMQGPTITVAKGKTHHFKLYDFPKDIHVTMRVRYVLDSGESVYTNELEI